MTEQEGIRIRAHHGLCTMFFEGRGYDAAFVRHMKDIIAGLKENPLIRVTDGADEICAGCPHLSVGKDGGRCREFARVKRYDRAVLKACGLQAGEQLSWSAFEQLVKERILEQGRREQICSDCQWDLICAGKTSGRTGEPAVFEDERKKEDKRKKEDGRRNKENDKG